MEGRYEAMVFMVFFIGFLFSGCVQEDAGTTTSTMVTTSSTAITTTTIQPTTSLAASSTTTSISTSGTSTTIASNPEVEASLSTDKGLYHSNELMDITVTVDSSSSLRDVDVRVYGINSRYYRLDKTEKKDLDVGLNTIKFSYKTPPCTGCAGISPGTYQVSVDLIYNGNVLATATNDVEIRQ
jgi:hypothetical protein